MKNLIAIVEKTGTGFSAYIEHSDEVIASTTGDTMHELRGNLKDSLDLYLETCLEMSIDISDIGDAFEMTLDVPQFFKYYKTLNASEFALFLGMNRSLLSQYATGTKTPSEKQSLKIVKGIHQLGKEYLSIEV